MSHYIQLLPSVLPALLAGFWLTLQLSFVGILWGSILGAIFGILRGQNIRFASPLIGFYLHILRGTPFLVQLYMIYFVLPNSGWSIFQFSSWVAATVGLGIYTSSYVTEIVAGALRAIPQSQWNAAFALGFGRMMALRLIILPQSIGLILPSLGGLYVTLVKATSIVSVVGIAELMRQAEIQIIRFPNDILSIYVLAGMLYFAFCFPFLLFIEKIEKRSRKNRIII